MTFNYWGIQLWIHQYYCHVKSLLLKPCLTTLQTKQRSTESMFSKLSVIQICHLGDIGFIYKYCILPKSNNLWINSVVWVSDNTLFLPIRKCQFRLIFLTEHFICRILNWICRCGEVIIVENLFWYLLFAYAICCKSALTF